MADDRSIAELYGLARTPTPKERVCDLEREVRTLSAIVVILFEHSTRDARLAIMAKLDELEPTHG